MIDIHAHILYGVDDGAADLTDALLMAELAAEGGTGIMIATPHGNLPGGCCKTWAGEDGGLLIEVKRRLEEGLRRKGIDLTIMLGMEIFATEDLAGKIRDKRVLPMPDKAHYMLEFDPGMPEALCRKIIGDVIETGARPIIAHPERYECIQADPKTAAAWREMGCEFQVNPEGILGRAAPRVCLAAEALIDADLVDYVASDAHDPYDRTPFLGDVYEFLKGNRSRAYADMVLKDNPMKLLIDDRGVNMARGQVWRFSSR